MHAQVLTSLAFQHSLNLLHADLKPENIQMASYSRCRVKVVDLGSSCYVTDRLSTYVQVGARPSQPACLSHVAAWCTAASSRLQRSARGVAWHRRGVAPNMR